MSRARPRPVRAAFLFAALAPCVSAQCDGLTWSPADLAPGDRFGASVALEGTWAFCGTPGDDSAASFAGAVRTFSSASGAWLPGEKLVAGDAGDADAFGSALCAHGDSLLVGAFAKDGGRGAVYVYERIGAAWVRTQVLAASDGVALANFGRAIATDGELAAVSAPGDPATGGATGAVYVFRFTDGAWVEEQKLTPPDGLGGDSFGAALALGSGHLLVGAPRDNELAPQAGAVYAWEEGEAGVQFRDKLFAPASSAQSYFGAALDLDGARALVGAPSIDGAGSGSVHALGYDGVAWSFDAELVATESTPGMQFGTSVSLSGERALVGAPSGSAGGRGSAHAFEDLGAGLVEVQVVVDPCLTAGAGLGAAVDLGGDVALLGAPGHGALGNELGFARVQHLFSCSLLTHDACALSATKGGEVVHGIDAGPQLAGQMYFLLGSATGTAPPLLLDGQLLPLAGDLYLLVAASLVNQPPFHDYFGMLDERGRGRARFTPGPAEATALVGGTLHQAYAVLRMEPWPMVISVSDAVSLPILP